MLKHLDAVYEHEGLAHLIVKTNMVGIYSASTANYQYKEESMNIAAGLFVAKFGGECNLYAMMLYFANYLIEYKGCYSAFDMQDILQQFNKKFLPFWRSKVKPYEAPMLEEHQTGSDYDNLIGRDAKIAMLGRRLINGGTIDDIRNCNLFKFGHVTEDDISDIVKYAENNF